MTTTRHAGPAALLTLLLVLILSPVTHAADTHPPHADAARVAEALVDSGVNQPTADAQVALLTPEDLAVLAANPGMLRIGGDNEDIIDDQAFVIAIVLGAIVVGVIFVGAFI